MTKISRKAVTHKADSKELAATKVCVVASRLLCLGQKAVLEHTAKTTANQHIHSACKEITVLSAALYIRHLNRET